MSVQIKRVWARRGVSRYRVNFPSSYPIEFLVPSPPHPQTREWQVLFARALAHNLGALAYLLEEHDGKA